MTRIHTATTLALPVRIDVGDRDLDSFINYYVEHREALEKELLTSGAVKFTGVRIGSTEDFQHIVTSISDKFLPYIDGNSPRTKLTGNVYTSTEFDPTQQITMHNELSYSAKWPNKIFFSCLQVAETGGETLIADSREILRHMDEAIVDEIERRGITYIRNLHGGSGMGPSWQDTFETGDKAQAEDYCRSYGIDFEWSGDTLRLKQASKGIIHHRITGEKLWFNQIDQFHPSHLDEELYETMNLMYDAPEFFPTYVTYGDGGEIGADTVDTILHRIADVTLAPAWGTNELLMLDNELIAHGRNPFTGSRRVLVAMSE